MATRWAAAHLRLRSEVRTKRAGFVLLVAVIAITSAVTMAAGVGARRSDSAYGRFRAWAHDSDIGVSGCECEPGDEEAAEQLRAAFTELRRAPFVIDSARISFAELVPELPDGTVASVIAFLPVIDVEDRLGREFPRVKLLHGRLPNPAAADEVAIGILDAERFHLSVGDELRLHTNDAQGRPHLLETARITGIYVAPGELPSASGPQGNSFLLTSGFARSFPEVIEPTADTLLLRLRPGTPRDEVISAIEPLGLGLDVNESADLTSGIERTIRVETVALLILGVVVAGVGLVVVGQMLRRQSVAEDDQALAFSALGCDRVDALRLGLLRGLTVGGLGALLGGAIAIGMSPLFPVGIGRLADPDVGFHADATMLGVGTLIVLTSVALLGILTARGHGRADHRSDVDASATPWPLPPSRPPVVVGWYLAVPGGGGRKASSPRISLVSLVVVVAILGATAVMLASFNHLVGHRDLAGATWQAAFLPREDTEGGASGALATVRGVPGVSAATLTGWATPDGLTVNGRPVPAQVFSDAGPIRPAVSRGRAPVVQGEIALGPKTLAAVGAHLGDEVELALTPTGPSIAGRVVGEVVLASPYFFDFAPGTGAATVASTFTALGTDAVGIVLVRYAAGADERRTFEAVATALGTHDAFETADRQNVSGLGRMRVVPVLLLCGLLALVAAAVAHVLIVAVARHRRDLAVLRAMGFTRRQSWASVTIHASLLVFAACLVGIPIGVVLGRAVWDRIATNLYVVPRPMAPLELLGLIGLALVVVAILASVVPAARAVRPPPAAVLRAD